MRGHRFPIIGSRFPFHIRYSSLKISWPEPWRCGKATPNREAMVLLSREVALLVHTGQPPISPCGGTDGLLPKVSLHFHSPAATGCATSSSSTRRHCWTKADTISIRDRSFHPNLWQSCPALQNTPESSRGRTYAAAGFAGLWRCGILVLKSWNGIQSK